MKSGPDIAETAALLAGQALTASELAQEAGVSRSTASTHLSRLETGGLIQQARQGRHRYFRLAGPDVGEILEQLLALSARVARPRTRPGPSEPQLREARVCYDHLAGATGVRMLDSLMARGLVRQAGEALTLTAEGEAFFLSLDLGGAGPSRRPVCRPCLDWSERRYHLAGLMGARVLDHLYAHGLARRAPNSRIVKFTRAGQRWFDDHFPLDEAEAA